MPYSHVHTHEVPISNVALSCRAWWRGDSLATIQNTKTHLNQHVHMHVRTYMYTCMYMQNIRVLSFSFMMESSEVASKLADSAAGRGSGKGAVVLLATLRGGAGTLNGSLLVRPLLDLVTRVGGVAETLALAAGRGGSFPDDFRLLCTTPPLQVCLRDVAVGGVKGGVAPVPMGVGGREMEYDL